MNELKADSIIHSFGARTILSGVFLSLRTGEIAGLLGRNGCGKSTLMKIMFGTLKADHGVVKVNDIYQEKAYAGKLVAYLPQHDFLPKDVTVRNISVASREGHDAQERILEREPFHALRDKRVGELSGGMLRLLEIVYILSLNRPFVLLDEPFTGLSPFYREFVHELLAGAENEKGIMITDHNYRNVIDISNRLILLKNGRTIPLGKSEELTGYNYLPNVRNI